MLWTLTRKEGLSHLLSLRFHLAVILVVGLMAGGALLFRGEYERQMDDYNAAVAARQQAVADASTSSSALFTVYSYLDQALMMRPVPLAFVAEGHQRDLPNTIEANAFRLQNLAVEQRGNPMMQQFAALDWSLVVSVVLSFAALVLTFDGFAGEKEDGTLRLVLANPVPRWMLVVSKLLGAWGVLMLGLLVGTILELLILLPGGWLVLDGGVLVRLAAAFALCGLYVALFVLLGLLVSARHATPAAALVVSLLVWAVVAVVIPRSTVLVAHGVEKVQRQGEVARRAWQDAEATQREYLRLHSDGPDWFSGHWSPGESLDMAFAMWRSWQAPYDAWRATQLRQVELARRLSFVSPAALLAAGLERVTGSGLTAYEQFLDAADRFREAMGEGLRARYPLDPANGYGRDQDADRRARAVRVSPAELPVFRPQSESAAAAVTAALGFGGALAVLDLLLLLTAVVTAGRYDVR
jgi:ABC-type transport system involved in multi-copper enzyme maturation permease subunit